MSESLSPSTVSQPEPESRSAEVPTEPHEASVGEKETANAQQSGMSEHAQREKEAESIKTSCAPGETMSRSQALAVAWTGIEALAKMQVSKDSPDERYAILYNSDKGILWIGIQFAQVNMGGRLIDLIEEKDTK